MKIPFHLREDLCRVSESAFGAAASSSLWPSVTAHQHFRYCPHCDLYRALHWNLFSSVNPVSSSQGLYSIVKCQGEEHQLKASQTDI